MAEYRDTSNGSTKTNSKKDHTAKYELLLVAILFVVFLMSQVMGTTKVMDESAGVDEDGLPVTDMTVEDLRAPGTRRKPFSSVEFGFVLDLRYYFYH